MPHRNFSRAVCAVALSLASISAEAANRTWTNAISGSFGVNTNWTGGAPTPSDKATFSANGAYTVTFNSAGSLPNPTMNQDLFVTGGNVTFTSSPGVPYLYRLTGTNGNASLTSGTLTLGSGSNPLNMTVDTNLTVQNATLNVNSGSAVNTTGLLLAQAGAGTIVVDGTGSALNVSGLNTNLGLNGNTAQLTYRNSSTGSIAGILGVGADSNAATTATMNVDTGADLSVGQLNIGTGTAAATGTVNVNGTGSTLVQFGANSLTVGTASAGIGTINIGTVTTGASFSTGSGLFTINKKGTVNLAFNSTLNANGNINIDGGKLNSVGDGFNLAANKTVTIQNGGLLSVLDASAANAVFSVTGASSKFELGGGEFDPGVIDRGAQVNVSDGAELSGYVSLGSSMGSGAISIQGPNSTANAFSLNVGYNSILDVGTSTSGGTLSSSKITINQTGAVRVGGSLSTGTLNAQIITVNGGTLEVRPGGGFYPPKEFTIQNGGRVVVDLAGGTYNFSLTYTDYNLTGAGSKWEFTNGTTVSIFSSFSNVNISSGATLSASGNVVYVGPGLNIDGGTLTANELLTSTNFLHFNTGTVGITSPTGQSLGATTWMGTDFSIYNGRALNISNTTTVPAGTKLAINGGSLSTRDLVVGGTFEFNRGTLNITSPNGFTIGSGQPLGTSFALDGTRSLYVTNTLTINAAAQLITVTGSELSAANLVNNGDLVAVNASINAPVVNNHNVTVIGSVDFNGPVSGPGGFFGPGTAHFNGGFSPGASPANISIEGSVSFADSNTLFIEIGGTTPGTQYDRLAIDGSATLDGELNISRLNGFMPTGGQQFTILTASSIVNNGFTLAGSAANLFDLIVGSTSVILQAIGLTGDYNHNGIVDATDYVVWRKSAGLTGPGLAADGNNNNQIDSGDLDVWRSHFGQASGSAAGTGLAGAVPEPNSLGLALVAMMVFFGRRGAVALSA
jgi:hypothetical protein